MLERDVRYLDSRIALLIANRMALDEVSTNRKCYEERREADGSGNYLVPLF